MNARDLRLSVLESSPRRTHQALGAVVEAAQFHRVEAVDGDNVFDRLERIWSSNEARAKLLIWFWLISLGVLLVGFGVIAWRFLVPR